MKCKTPTLEVEITCIEFGFVSNRMQLPSWTVSTSRGWNLIEIQFRCILIITPLQQEGGGQISNWTHAFPSLTSLNAFNLPEQLQFRIPDSLFGDFYVSPNYN